MSVLLTLFLPLLANAAEIHEYVKQEDLRKVDVFLKEGGNPNLPDEKGYPPLYWAIQKNNIPIARSLIQYKANVNARVNTVIRVAFPGSDHKPGKYTTTCSLLFTIPSLEVLDMMELLLKNKANANARCDNNNTLLHEAAIMRELPVIKLLLKYKANIDIPGGRDGSTPLHTAVRLKYEEVVRFLIRNRANVNARDHNGNIPLHRAAAAMPPHKGIIKLLTTSNRADVNIRNNRNLRPIDIAKNLGHPKDIQHLFQKRNTTNEVSDEDRR